MSTNLSKIDPKEFGLEVEQVSTIEQAFMPKIQEREALVKIYDQLIKSELTPELCKQAKEVRLKLVKVRTGIADIHKTQKAFFLAAGRFVDAWKNKETVPVEQMEEKLSEIENYYINLEKERIAKLEIERTELVKKYTDFPAAGLGAMADEVFNAYLTGCKVSYEAKIEAERKAEEERLEKERKEKLHFERKNKTIRLIDFIENYELINFGELSDNEFQELCDIAIKKRAEFEFEQEQIRIENQRLKAESEKKKKELAEAEKKLKAEQEAARIAAKKAAEEKEKLEAELKAKADAEAKARKEKEAAEKKAKNAPDKEKLLALQLKINLIEFPDLKSDETIEILNNVKLLLTKVSNYITEKTNNL